MSEITAPFLPEHQAPDISGGSKPGYNPSPEERKTIQLVDSMYSKAKKYRKRYDGKWIDYYKMFRGKQWKEVRPSYRHSEVLNLVFQTIESMVPTLTDSRPKLEYLPTTPDQHELADILTKVAENDWTHNNWLYTLTEILFDSHFYGTGIGTCYFDQKANLGLGNICFESTDIFYFFPDPSARDINEKYCRSITLAEPTDLSKLKKDYPRKAQYFTSDVIDLAQGDKADINQVMFKSPVDSKLITEGVGGYDNLDRTQALKLTCLFKDDSFDEEEQEALKSDGTPDLDENGQPKSQFVQKLKYPNGRKIVVAGGVLCEDGPMEEDDGLFPYMKMVNYILPREFWGMGEVEQLEGPQKTINKLISFSLDVMTLMGNPVWTVPTSAGIDTDNLFNKPGLIIEYEGTEAPKRDPGVGLQPFVLELFDKYRQIFDGLSGQTDLSRGAEPTDVTAASAIEDLQEAQHTRLRLKSRNVDAFLQQMGKIYLNRVFQHYSVPRIIRVTGDDNVTQYFHFHVEKLEQEDGSVKKFAHIVTKNPDGSPNPQILEITGDFDVRISTGSTLPFAKAQKFNQSMTLFKANIIDDEEVLKNIEYPNYEAVLARVQQKKAAEAQAQQQAQIQQAQATAQAKQGMPPGSAPPPSGGAPTQAA